MRALILNFLSHYLMFSFFGKSFCPSLNFFLIFVLKLSSLSFEHIIVCLLGHIFFHCFLWSLQLFHHFPVSGSSLLFFAPLSVSQHGTLLFFLKYFLLVKSVQAIVLSLQSWSFLFFLCFKLLIIILLSLGFIKIILLKFVQRPRIFILYKRNSNLFLKISVFRCQRLFLRRGVHLFIHENFLFDFLFLQFLIYLHDFCLDLILIVFQHFLFVSQNLLDPLFFCFVTFFNFPLLQPHFRLFSSQFLLIRNLDHFEFLKGLPYFLLLILEQILGILLSLL